MSMFTLNISFLTTSSLPWSVDLVFQIPIQYCSLQHWTLLPHWVLFSLWLNLFILTGVISPLISSSILGTYCPGEFIFQCHTFLPFHTVHGFSRQEYWSGLPFPSPVDKVLSELSAMTHLSWVALHGMAHSFIELDKAVWSVWSDWLVFCDCGFQLVCPLMDEVERLMEASWWERLTEGETGSCSDGWGHAQ